MAHGLGFRLSTHRALGSLAALASATWLIACSTDGSISTDNVPAAAATTTPSTVVTPVEPFRPWETDEQTTADSPAPTTSATGLVAPTAITTVPTEEAAPVEERNAQELCDVDAITRDVGEASDVTPMIVSYCDGRWAHVALYATDFQGWILRSEDQWEWPPADGSISTGGMSVGCFLPETVDSFEPIPAAARADLPICGPEDLHTRAS